MFLLKGMICADEGGYGGKECGSEIWNDSRYLVLLVSCPEREIPQIAFRGLWCTLVVKVVLSYGVGDVGVKSGRLRLCIDIMH